MPDEYGLAVSIFAGAVVWAFLLSLLLAFLSGGD